MRFLSKSIKADDVRSAVRLLQGEYAGFPIKTLIFFASSAYDDPELARLIRDAFPGALTFGCSSYGEVCKDNVRYGTIAALGFGPGALDLVAAGAAENISADPGSINKAIQNLENQVGSKLIDLSYSRHLGVTLFDGSSPNIEKVIERLADQTHVTFIGGFASDDFSMVKIRQHLDGKTYTDSAIVAILKPSAPFSLLKTQSAEPLDKSFTVTKADESDRIILELDNRPAAEVYAEGIGIPGDKITEDAYLRYPLGLMANGDPFIRAGRRILDNGGLQLFCSAKKGQRLCLMHNGDIVAKTAARLAEERQKLGGKIEAILDFDCAHRFMALEADKRLHDYGLLFRDSETAGFATFGEAYIANVNQTSVMALFA